MRKLADGRGLAKVSEVSRQIADGEVDLSDWSDEELLRGRRADKNGKFRGSPPKLIPIRIHQELNRRRMQRAYALLSYSVLDAVKMFAAIVRDEDAPRRTRIRAGEVILDRVLGKPREHIDFTLGSDEEPPWAKALASAVVGVIGTAEAPEPADVVEGEVVDERPALPDRATPRKHPADRPARSKAKVKKLGPYPRQPRGTRRKR